MGWPWPGIFYALMPCVPCWLAYSYLTLLFLFWHLRHAMPAQNKYKKWVFYIYDISGQANRKGGAPILG